MRHYLFLAASAALMLASCTNEVDFSQESLQAQNESQTAVQFGTYMGKTGTTRAGTTGAITTTTLQTGTHANDGFAVFAYNTGVDNWATTVGTGGTPVTPNFMYNQQVKYNSTSSKWEYTPLKYWPNGTDAANSANNPSNTATESSIQYLSFFAYAPYVEATASSGAISSNSEGITALTSNATAGEPKVTYKFHYDSSNSKFDLSATNNVDLLWGLRSAGTYKETDGTDNTTSVEGYNTDLTKQNTTETIDFYFKHALAKLGGYEGSTSGIKVVADFDDNTETNTKATETLITLNSIKIENGTSGDPAASTLKAGGIFNLATGSWDLTDATASPAMTFSNEYTNSTTGVNAQVWETATPSYSSGWQISSTSVTGVTNDAKDVFTSDTAPLYLIPGTGATLKVTVQYTVRTYDANLAAPATGEATCSKVTQTIINSVDISSFASNKAYTLIIHLGLTSVKFAATVADWDDGTSGGGSGNTQIIWLPSNVIGS